MVERGLGEEEEVVRLDDEKKKHFLTRFDKMEKYCRDKGLFLIMYGINAFFTMLCVYVFFFFSSLLVDSSNTKFPPTPSFRFISKKVSAFI